MKQLVLYTTLFIPGLALAHPGHAVAERFHATLHSEHLLVVVAIAAVLLVTVGIIKKFK